MSSERLVLLCLLFFLFLLAFAERVSTAFLRVTTSSRACCAGERSLPSRTSANCSSCSSSRSTSSTSLCCRASSSVSTTFDERSGRPDIDQANKIQKPNKKEPKRERGDPLFADSGRASSEIPKWLQQIQRKFGG